MFKLECFKDLVLSINPNCLHIITLNFSNSSMQLHDLYLKIQLN